MPTIDGCHVPDRFSEAITLHLVLNMLASNDLTVPLILGIHGPSGDGKTFQSELVLKEMGVRTLSIAPRELESSKAGEPSRLLYERYWEASRIVTDGQAKSAMLILEDLDLGIGSWGKMVQYTVNTQLLVDSLMAIADRPRLVGSRETARIPILATGNDLARLYPPLLREGRTSLFHWRPSVSERVQVVSRIFPEDVLSADDCAALVEKYSDRSVAFFAQIRAHAVSKILIQRMAGIELAAVLRRIDDIRGDGRVALRLTIADLVEVATDLEASVNRVIL